MAALQPHRCLSLARNKPYGRCDGSALSKQQTQTSPGNHNTLSMSCVQETPYGQAESSTVPLLEQGLLLHMDPEVLVPPDVPPSVALQEQLT